MGPVLRIEQCPTADTNGRRGIDPGRQRSWGPFHVQLAHPWSCLDDDCRCLWVPSVLDERHVPVHFRRIGKMAFVDSPLPRSSTFIAARYPTTAIGTPSYGWIWASCSGVQSAKDLPAVGYVSA